jgi:hypothetical protein
VPSEGILGFVEVIVAIEILEGQISHVHTFFRWIGRYV